MLIFVIIEISVMYFVDTTLDNAVHQSARKIRVGSAAEKNWTIKDFKNDICSNMLLSFGCSSNLIVRVTVISDMSNANYVNATSNGILTATNSYNIGVTGSYLLVQAFLPWSPVLRLYSLSSATLADGTYVLGAAALFKNEPF